MPSTSSADRRISDSGHSCRPPRSRSPASRGCSSSRPCCRLPRAPTSRGRCSLTCRHDGMPACCRPDRCRRSRPPAACERSSTRERHRRLSTSAGPRIWRTRFRRPGFCRSRRFRLRPWQLCRRRRSGRAWDRRHQWVGRWLHLTWRTRCEQRAWRVVRADRNRRQQHPGHGRSVGVLNPGTRRHIGHCGRNQPRHLDRVEPGHLDRCRHRHRHEQFD